MQLHASEGRRSSRVAIGVSLGLHVAGAIVVAIYITANVITDRAIVEDLAIEWVTVPETTLRRRSPLKQLAPITEDHTLAEVTDSPPDTASPDMVPEVVHRTMEMVTRTVDVQPKRVSDLLSGITTAPDLAATDVDVGAEPASSTPQGTKAGRGIETGRVRAAAAMPTRLGIGLYDSMGAAATVAPNLDDLKFSDTTALLADGELGAVLVGEGRDVSGHIRIIRAKHSLSDWWQDPTAMSSLIGWLDEHTRLRADMKFQGGSLSLDDPRILDAPLVIMTGHDRSITVSHQLERGGPLVDGFTDAESLGLRTYLIERGGTLFFDDCGWNGLLAERVKQELERALPEYALIDVPHSHEVYTIYYELAGPPDGGDIFWGSENNPKQSKFRSHKAIFIADRLAVLFNRKDYMCAMETTEVASRTMLRLRRSPNVYRFMTNLFVYAMKYGGNVDRSGYEPY
jgi:hypothetical protein